MHWRRDDVADPAHTTCQWILEHGSYKKWYKNQRGLLWIKGNPGAGKSTVLKYAFKAAKQNNEGLILASFFFHGRGSLIQKSPLGLFRSLLHQILQQVPDLLTEFASLYRQRCNTEGEQGQKWDWRERDLQDFFTSHVTEKAEKYTMRLYIDALDECGQDPAISLVEYFCRFADPIAICFACRHYPIISLEEAGFELSVEHENAPDIDAYITKRIEPTVRNIKSANTIRHELKKRSAGNFQWVVLVTTRVIQFFRNGKPLKAICALIQRLPSELANLYDEMVRRAEPDDMIQALHLFQWICFAFRPLTLQELREATALDIQTYHASLQESRTFGQYAETDEEMVRRVLSLSQGLAEVETHGSRRTVQVVHQSVIDFLLQDGFRLFDEQLPGDHLTGSVIARGHFWISRACIKFISMEKVTSLGFPGPESNDKDLLPDHSERFPLMSYAAKYCIAHSQIVEKENVFQDDLVALLQPPSCVLRVLQGQYRGVKDWRDESNEESLVSLTRGMTLLHVASAFGLSSVVSCILKRGAPQRATVSRANPDPRTSIDTRDDDGRTPLHWVSLLGHEATKTHAKYGWGSTPVYDAAKIEHESIPYLLLEAGAAVDPSDNGDSTPLSLACFSAHQSTVELLLRWGAKADTMNRRRETPLSHAVRKGSQAIVEFLLNKGAQVNTVDKKGQSPISSAAGDGHEYIVRLLLEHGASTDPIDSHDNIPLHLAVRGGYKNVVELLLKWGAKVDTMDNQDDTPLFQATVRKSRTLVELLLNAGAKADTMNRRRETPLFYAACKGSRTIVKLLLKKGAQVNTMDKRGQSPLLWALRYGHVSTARLLLEHGANPNSINGHVISSATKKDFDDILERLNRASKGKSLPPAHSDRSNQMETAVRTEGDGSLPACHTAAASQNLPPRRRSVRIARKPSGGS